jgi:esterase/lipase
MYCNVTPDYFIPQPDLPFDDYIAHCSNLITSRRIDLETAIEPKRIITANTPFELNPTQGNGKFGALLIHGLLDSPFTMLDIGKQLQQNGIASKSILLPGHGTQPKDLLNVSHHDWLKTVQYGVESLAKEVDHLYLIGYSTGAILSIHHALRDSTICGVVLLAPAIKVRAPTSTLIQWRKLTKWANFNTEWISKDEENDYTKYQSVAMTPVIELDKLIQHIIETTQSQQLRCPLFMIMSREDETVSSQAAIEFFKRQINPQNKLLLYSSKQLALDDKRIRTQKTYLPELNIEHFSHSSLPHGPENSHYGEQGDYSYATRLRLQQNVIFGAYNRLETKMFDKLYQLGLLKYQRQTLTYNPAFNDMTDQISEFILARLRL